MRYVLFPGWGRIALLTGGGLKVHGEATVVEVDKVIPGNGNPVIGKLAGVQGDRESGFALHAAGKAQVMDLDEVIGIVAFLGRAFQVGLANNVDFHFSFFVFVL